MLLHLCLPPWEAGVCINLSTKGGGGGRCMSLRRCEWRVCGCGRPHPSHPFIEPNPTVYKIAWAAQEEIPTDKILADEEIDVCKMKELIVHPIV